MPGGGPALDRASLALDMRAKALLAAATQRLSEVTAGWVERNLARR